MMSMMCFVIGGGVCSDGDVAVVDVVLADGVVDV